MSGPDASPWFIQFLFETCIKARLCGFSHRMRNRTGLCVKRWPERFHPRILSFPLSIPGYTVRLRYTLHLKISSFHCDNMEPHRGHRGWMCVLRLRRKQIRCLADLSESLWNATWTRRHREKGEIQSKAAEPVWKIWKCMESYRSFPDLDGVRSYTGGGDVVVSLSL